MDDVIQVLKAALLRPVRVHLQDGRSFTVRSTDYVLAGLNGFIISRPRPCQAPIYVEQVRSNEVVAFDLKLKWRLYVAPSKAAGKADASEIRKTLGMRAKTEKNVLKTFKAAGINPRPD